MRVFVTGATGAIGSHTVPTLVKAGCRVSALARSDAKAAALRGQGADPVQVSIFDRPGLTRVLAGHDAVVNLATAIPPTVKFMRRSAWRENDRIRTEGSAALVDASLAAGVGRLIQESVVMLYPDRGDKWINEDVPIDHYPMAAGNLAAEASANRFSEAGRTAVVLRFGWFYGPGAKHSEQMVAQARHHIAMMLGPPGSYVSVIHLADASSGVTAALKAPAGTFNIVDDEPLTKRQFVDALAEATRTSLWVRTPGRAARLLGDRLTSLTRSLRVSNRRFRQATGWAPRYPSACEGWHATLAALS